MDKKIIIILVIIAIGIVFFFLLNIKFTGNVIDSFPQENLHWTHMPLTYQIDKTCTENESAKIKNAFNKIQESTNNSVSFLLSNESDIAISCPLIEGCYEKKTRKFLFWTINTEVICEHETGSSQITKIKGNKIFKAEIKLTTVKGYEECNDTNTEIHEILHTFNYPHSENNESIMYPTKYDCVQKEIDSEIVNDLIAKYQTSKA